MKDTISGLEPGIFNCTYGLLAIGFNAILLLFLNPKTDYLIWIFVNIIAAFAFHMLILAQKRHKFRHPISNYELESLVSRAKDRLEISRKVELWAIDDSGFVLTRATNLLFSCIIMSSSVINKLLEKPDSGEIILADELIRIDRGSRKFLFVWDFMHYFLFSTAVFALQETIFQLLLPVGVIFLQAMILLLALALFTFTIRSRYIPSKPDIDGIYGKTRADAEHDVFGEIDRGIFSFIGRSAPRARMDESSEFRIGMLPAPLVISLICGAVTYFIFTIPLPVFLEKLPFVILPVSVLFAALGFAFSFDLINPIKYVYPQSHSILEQPPFEDDQTQHLAELLHEIPQYAELHVQKRKTGIGRIRTEIFQDSDVLSNYAYLSDIVTGALEPDELLIYAIAELKRNNLRQKDNKWIVRSLEIITLLIFLCGFLAVVVFHQPIVELVILLLFLYAALIFGSLALSSVRINSKFRQIDRKIQREYPLFFDILEKLQDKGNNFERNAYKERFEDLEAYMRINRSRYSRSNE